MIKRLVGAIKRYGLNTNYQDRAAKKFDRIAKGEKVLSPRYDNDKMYIERATADPNIKKDLETKHEVLIDNTNKMHINASEPIEHPTSSRPLPTNESERRYAQRESFMYGFYEPPPDKIPPNRLTLHEAIDLMQAQLEIKYEGANATGAEQLLQTARAVQCIDAERLHRIFTYFAPFERFREQHLVYNSDLEIAYRDAIGVDDLRKAANIRIEMKRESDRERSIAAIDDEMEVDARRLIAERENELRRQLTPDDDQEHAPKKHVESNKKSS